MIFFVADAQIEQTSECYYVYQHDLAEIHNLFFRYFSTARAARPRFVVDAGSTESCIGHRGNISSTQELNLLG